MYHIKTDVWRLLDPYRWFMEILSYICNVSSMGHIFNEARAVHTTSTGLPLQIFWENTLFAQDSQGYIEGLITGDLRDFNVLNKLGINIQTHSGTMGYANYFNVKLNNIPACFKFVRPDIDLVMRLAFSNETLAEIEIGKHNISNETSIHPKENPEHYCLPWLGRKLGSTLCVSIGGSASHEVTPADFSPISPGSNQPQAFAAKYSLFIKKRHSTHGLYEVLYQNSDFGFGLTIQEVGSKESWGFAWQRLNCLFAIEINLPLFGFVATGNDCHDKIQDFNISGIFRNETHEEPFITTGLADDDFAYGFNFESAMYNGTVRFSIFSRPSISWYVNTVITDVNSQLDLLNSEFLFDHSHGEHSYMKLEAASDFIVPIYLRHELSMKFPNFRSTGPKIYSYEGISILKFMELTRNYSYNCSMNFKHPITIKSNVTTNGRSVNALNGELHWFKSHGEPMGDSRLNFFATEMFVIPGRLELRLQDKYDNTTGRLTGEVEGVFNGSPAALSYSFAQGQFGAWNVSTRLWADWTDKEIRARFNYSRNDMAGDVTLQLSPDYSVGVKLSNEVDRMDFYILEFTRKDFTNELDESVFYHFGFKK